MVVGFLVDLVVYFDDTFYQFFCDFNDGQGIEVVILVKWLCILMVVGVEWYCYQ